MKPLDPPDTHNLKAAEGWLELGNHLEANEELEKIAPALRSHPDVLNLRWQIYAKAAQWEVCLDIATVLLKVVPKQPTAWINRSYALHELKRTEEALELLEPAADLFSDVWMIRYNMACYACQLGNQDEAWEWLEDAIDLADDAKAVKLMALNDNDLESLWAEIGEI